MLLLLEVQLENKTQKSQVATTVMQLVIGGNSLTARVVPSWNRGQERVGGLHLWRYSKLSRTRS